MDAATLDEGFTALLQAIAIGWHMYQMTDSTLALGLTALFRVIPFMTLSLVGMQPSSEKRRRML